jgi:hypothetical protein
MARVIARKVDQFFGGLLLIGAILHGFGSIANYPARSQILVWALAGSLAAGLLAVLNLVRARRPADRTLAWITFFGSLCWVAVAIGFGVAIGNVYDPRPLWHAITALVLAAFCLRTALGWATSAAA